MENGEVRLAALGNRVYIEFDKLGVPYIRAKTDHDVFFAMGYLHARDRMWQMEVQRRTAKGKLSEIVGASALEADIYMRTLGLVAAALDAWEALSADGKGSLQAYADGVNSWLGTNPRLPPEFTLIGIRPEKWTVIDSLAWMKVFSLNLSVNYLKELARFATGSASTDPKVRAILGLEGNGPSVAVGPDQGKIASLAVLQSSIQNMLAVGGTYVGSNAWVVSERFLEKKGTMLANDPHLALSSPSLWYPVSQVGDKLKTSGMSLVGLPLVVFGRNDDIAWGGTAMEADVQDLYLEQVNPADPSLYLSNGTWTKFDSHNEHIAIKAESPEFLHEAPKPVDVTIRATRHGPVISDRLGVSSQPLSLRWTGLTKNDTTFDAFLGLSYAKNWSDFKKAISFGVAPALNILYIDRIGNIGMQGFGQIPLRTKGHGNVPSIGWNDSDEWSGIIPFPKMPTEFNPERGFIVSANNRNVPTDYPYFISDDWAPPGRADRIKHLLQQYIVKDGKLDVARFQQMQLDVRSTPAARLAGLLTNMATTNQLQRDALKYLVDWDGEMGSDSQAATIFTAWMDHFKTELFSKYLHSKIPAADEFRYLDGIVTGISLETIHAVLSGGDSKWCASISDKNAPKCNDELAASLDSAILELKKLSGTDMKQWKWGNVHFASYRHYPFSNVRFLKHIFEQNADGGGSADTINVANSIFDRTDGYKQTVGPTFRQVIQMGPAPSTHFFVNSTGQSGNIFSRNYSDANHLFTRGEYLEFLTAEQVASGSAIVLIPAQEDLKR